MNYLKNAIDYFKLHDLGLIIKMLTKIPLVQKATNELGTHGGQLALEGGELLSFHSSFSLSTDYLREKRLFFPVLNSEFTTLWRLIR